MSSSIGIVGGMGTYAGIDLLSKIADNTEAGSDQEHLPVIMISEPEKIPDRTEYLLGQIEENPGYAISGIAKRLAGAGAGLIALPCNTAHVPEIVNIVMDGLPENCRIVNMIEETGNYCSYLDPPLGRVGILATNGTVESGVYNHYFNKTGVELLYPNKDSQYNLVHPSIYDPVYGIKAQSNPVHERAVSDLYKVAEELISNGAQALILGCTEIPLALTEDSISGIPLIDPGTVLAKALVREYRLMNQG